MAVAAVRVVQLTKAVKAVPSKSYLFQGRRILPLSLKKRQQVSFD